MVPAYARRVRLPLDAEWYTSEQRARSPLEAAAARAGRLQLHFGPTASTLAWIRDLSVTVLQRQRPSSTSARVHVTQVALLAELAAACCCSWSHGLPHVATRATARPARKRSQTHEGHSPSCIHSIELCMCRERGHEQAAPRRFEVCRADAIKTEAM